MDRSRNINFTLTISGTFLGNCITCITTCLGVCLVIFLSTISNTAKAGEEEKKITHFTSGTGFYISGNYIVTNDHVVKDCKYIKVRGATKSSHATVISRDSVNDLALLTSPVTPTRYAMFRGDNIPVKIGETVTVMGYPLEYGIKGDYLIKNAIITDTEDIYEGIKRLQFTDSVEKGNSGGPLLDSKGNVIGVVVGKMSFYLADSDMSNIYTKPVKTSSMAINLEHLRNFLDKQNIMYYTSNIPAEYEDPYIEQKAKQYIVNVHCVKDVK